jgi:Fe-S-cluster-containing hydrogenase component 2
VGVRIDAEVCEATGVCAQVCPEDVFEHEDGVTRVVQAQACTECWTCVENCASGAIEID